MHAQSQTIETTADLRRRVRALESRIWIAELLAVAAIALAAVALWR
jgi:hypothetical protein